MEKVVITHYESPAGNLILGSFGSDLCLCDWLGSPRRSLSDRRIRRVLGVSFVEGNSDILEETASQLNEYFDKARTDFTIPVRFAGSDFQCSVWSELMKIPYGQTISYGRLASWAGNPRAVRAVASAVASNPISIIVPCHRVIGSDHSLTGYAGGLTAKQYLLSLETEIPSLRLSF